MTLRAPDKCGFVERTAMKNRFSKFAREEGIIFLIILLSLFLFWLPYFGQGFTNGSEVKFHYARIMTLADSLKVGIFPAKVRPSHMRLFGYGIGFFYPDLLIYPPAALIALGAGYDITVKVYLFIVTLIQAVLVYRCFKELTGNKWISLLGEILVMNSAINIQNIFGGGGMPHLFAYLFIPLALCGLLRAMKDEKGGYIEFAAGLTMILLTHNMIFLTFMFVMVIIVLLNLGNIVRKPLIIVKLLGVSFASMIVTTAYWLPAMEQVSHIDFIVFHDNAYSVTDHILSPYKLFLSDIGILYTGLFVVFAALYVFMLIRKRKMPADINIVLITTGIVIIFSCSKTIWLSKIGEVLSFFEYTDRFEFVLSVLMTLFVVMILREAAEEFKFCADLLGKGKELWPILISIALLVITRTLSIPGFLSPAGDNRIMLTYDLLTEDWQVSGAEWLPVECEPTECKNAENARASDGSSADGFKHENGKYFEVWVGLDREYYDMPYVYYYGYHAYLLDENENPVRELEVGEAFDDNGYVRVFTPEDEDGIGHILVIYRKTAIQKLSYLVSFISVALLCFFYSAKKFFEMRQSGGR